MDNKSSDEKATDQATEKRQGSKLTGVRCYERTGAKKPYVVELRWADKSRTYESFRTAGSRDARAASLERQLKGAEAVPVLTSEQVSEYLAIKEAINGTPWTDVIAGWRLLRTQLAPEPFKRTVQECVNDFLAEAAVRLERQQISPDTHRQKKAKLNLFALSFGHVPMCEVTPEAISQWLDDLEVENATFNDYLKHLRSFFADYAKELRGENPAERVERLPDGIDEVGIISPAETAKLFAYARTHYPEALGRLALEAFAGLRFSSANRLEKADINFEDKGILLPKKKLKTKRRFYVDELPDNLWAWLQETTPDCWTLTPTDWMHLKSKLFKKAEVPHPHNALRHSFCTYHVAAFKNPGRTATILCHTNQAKLWSNYYGRGTKADGLAYFAILPAL